jgi:hypothetical protein
LARRVADTTPSIDRIDQHLKFDASRADEKWEEWLTLSLVPAGFGTDWLAFSDACIMQSRVRGGSYQLDPGNPRIFSEAGTLVPCTSTQPRRKDRTDSLIGYIRWRLHPSACEVEMHPSCISGAADQPTLA